MAATQLTAYRRRRDLFDKLSGLLKGEREIERFDDYITGEVMTENKRLFTTAEAAAVLLVHPETVRRWIREGEIVAQELGRSKRIERSELERFWRSRGGGALFSDSEPDK